MRCGRRSSADALPGCGDGFAVESRSPFGRAQLALRFVEGSDESVAFLPSLLLLLDVNDDLCSRAFERVVVQTVFLPLVVK